MPQHTTHVRSVLFVTYHFPPEVGGIQTRIQNYCRDLRRRGIGVEVVFPSRRAKIVKTYSVAGATVIAVPGQLKHLPQNLFRVARTAITRRVDVVHVFTGSSTLLGLLALTFGRMISASSTMSIFGMEDMAFSSIASKIFFLLSAEVATSISANSRATASLLPSKYVPKTRILLGGALANMDQTLQRNSHSDPKEILFVGRLVKRKGVDDLLKSFSIVEKSLPAARLIIIGDGPEREELSLKSQELGLRNVVFKGALFGGALQKEYSECSVCVLPSKHVPEDPATEGLGLTLIEASMHAKPLVGTIHGGIPEVIKDGFNGILVPEGSPQKLADAILTILCNEDVAAAMGNNAFRLARTALDWSVATDRLLESYKR